MRVMLSAMALMLASGAAATPAFAQDAEAPVEACTENLSGKINKEIMAIQEAGVAKDWATMKTLIDEARGKAKSKDDKCLVERFALQHASNTGNMAASMAAVKAAHANGLPDKMAATSYLQIGQLEYQNQNYATAATAFMAAIALDPSSDSALWLADTRAKQGQPEGALSDIAKAIKLRGEGAEVPNDWYARAVTIAYQARTSAGVDLARQWVVAYPTPTNWRDAIILGIDTLSLNERATLDMLRLEEQVGALDNVGQIKAFSEVLLLTGFAAEASDVLKKKTAEGLLEASDRNVKELLATAKTNMIGDRESIEKSAAAAMAKGKSDIVLQLAENYIGYGEYQASADLARKALGMSGVNNDRGNLRLGVALALAGDKAGAVEALSKATGNWGEVAKYWLAYLATQG